MSELKAGDIFRTPPAETRGNMILFAKSLDGTHGMIQILRDDEPMAFVAGDAEYMQMIAQDILGWAKGFLQ